MSTKKVTKQQKIESRQTIVEELHHLLDKYKNGSDEKKYEKSLKKASKVLSKVIVISTPKKVQSKKTGTK